MRPKDPVVEEGERSGNISKGGKKKVM